MGTEKYGDIKNLIKHAGKQGCTKFLTHILENEVIDLTDKSGYIIYLGYTLGKMAAADLIKKYHKICTSKFLFQALCGLASIGNITDTFDILKLYGTKNLPTLMEFLIVKSIKSGNLTLFELLLNNLSPEVAKSARLMREAARRGKMNIIKLLISRGNEYYSRALADAYCAHQVEAVELLSEKVSQMYELHTPHSEILLYEARNGRLEKTIKSLTYITDNALPIINNALLLVANNDENLSLVKQLIQQGADAFLDALDCAITHNCPKIVKFLLSVPKFDHLKPELNDFFKYYIEERSQNWQIYDNISIEIYAALFEYIDKNDQLEYLQCAAAYNDFKLIKLIVNGVNYPIPDTIMYDVSTYHNQLITDYILYLGERNN